MTSMFAFRSLGLALAVVASLGFAGCTTPVNLGNILPGGDDENSETAQEIAATPNTVTFEPIQGMPESIAGPFAAQLSQEAASRQLRIVPPTDRTAAIRASGSFDAQRAGNETVITYLWDLKDPNGNQRSRFGGERRVRGTSSDPWSVVGDQEIGAMAVRVIEEIQRVNGTLP